jgi:hypothetical protein
MKVVDLKEAINEAERFLIRARKINPHVTQEGKVCSWIDSGADPAACKRASMDLSRALSKMRRP